MQSESPRLHFVGGGYPAHPSGPARIEGTGTARAPTTWQRCRYGGNWEQQSSLKISGSFGRRRYRSRSFNTIKVTTLK